MHPIDTHGRRVLHDDRADLLHRTMLADARLREEPDEPDNRVGPRLITTIQRPASRPATAR